MLLLLLSPVSIRPRRRREGKVLLLAVIAVTGVATLTAGMLQLSAQVTRSSIGRVDRSRAFYAAEAGLAEAFSGLQLGRSGNVGTAALPAAFDHGLFFVEAEELGDELVRLESTGMADGGRARLSLVARRGRPSVATLGTFADEDLAVGPGTRVDAYDSRLGPYSEQAPALAQIGSNGAVGVEGTRAAPTFLHADVAAGPDSAVTTTGAVTIEGAIGTAPASVDLPPVEVPQVELGRGTTITEVGVPTIVQGGTGGLVHLHVAAGAQVVLEGPATWVIGSLAVAAEGELAFDTSAGPVELYVTEALELAPGSFVDTGGEDGTGVSLQVAGETADPVTLAAAGAFAGVVYAPQAEVEIGAGFEFFGALVARRLTLEGGASLHFDLALTAAAAEAMLPRLRSWRILELSQPGRGPFARDPFAQLGVARAACPAPADAHADQWLDVTYVDGGGVQNYTGLESGFDWSFVDELLSGARDGVPFDLPQPRAAGAPGIDVANVLTDPGLTSGEKRDALLDASPLTEAELHNVVLADPPLASADLLAVLQANQPLSDRMAADVVEDAALSGAELLTLLSAQPPLTPQTQVNAVSRPDLTDAELVSILLLAAPNPTAVFDELALRTPALSAAEQTRLLAGQ